MLRDFKASKPIMVHMAKIKQDNINNLRVHVRWYYRPVGAIGDASWFVRLELHQIHILKLLHFLIYEPHCFIYIQTTSGMFITTKLKTFF